MEGWASLGQPVACEDWYVKRKEKGESAVRRRSSGGDAHDARGLRLPSDLSVWRATAAHPESVWEGKSDSAGRACHRSHSAFHLSPSESQCQFTQQGCGMSAQEISEEFVPVLAQLY